ncbi:hypothetical protein J2750_002439 [Methanococcoides alaskense]|uniref:Uncharacterized protein n=1 Tax=Methanococcoides alaskense TaxID=325778 RepID=A0AA90ZDW2_9EURY|nr:hypothetical protein [Methanococcoides alaskense]
MIFIGLAYSIQCNNIYIKLFVMIIIIMAGFVRNTNITQKISR